MTDRPILFSGEMVRALLDGRKTQTRRPLMKQPPEHFSLLGIYGPGLTAVFTDGGPDNDVTAKLPFVPGDRLWVRETWNIFQCSQDGEMAWPFKEIPKEDPRPNKHRSQIVVDYAADSHSPDERWRPSIHMPRWASRITLLVDDVKVQRLQDISDQSARAEGCQGWYSPCHPDFGSTDGQLPREQFASLWNTLHPDQSWDANPWVVAPTFRVIKQNIDQIERNAA